MATAIAVTATPTQPDSRLAAPSSCFTYSSALRSCSSVITCASAPALSCSAIVPSPGGGVPPPSPAKLAWPKAAEYSAKVLGLVLRPVDRVLPCDSLTRDGNGFPP